MTRGLRVVVALAAALAAFGLFFLSQRLYAQAKFAALEPIQPARHASANAPLPPAEGRPRLVLIGDSRAAGWPAGLAPAGMELINRGIGGETAARLTRRLDEDALALRPAVIVIQSGVNDLVAASLAAPPHSQRIAQATEMHLRALVARARQGGARVVLMTVIPPGDVGWWRRPFWSERARGLVTALNAALREAPPPGVLLLDAAAALGEPDRVARGLQLDTLHLKPEAYARLGESLAALLAHDAPAGR